MKFLALTVLLVLSNTSFAAVGGGSSPFIPLSPIIINLRDGNHIRHMQVIIEVKLTGPASSKKFDLHKGPIRHELILLLSNQEASNISNAKGKEKLRKEALAAVQKVLQELEGEPIIEALYFTNFIIQ